MATQAQLDNVSKKLAAAESEASVQNGTQAIDISDILQMHVRRIGTPKTDKGAKKVIGGMYVSNNYEAVAFAADNGLIDKGLKAEYARLYTKGKQERFKSPKGEGAKARTLSDAIEEARRDGKLVDISDLKLVSHGKGDKAYMRAQGFRTIKDTDKFGPDYKGKKQSIVEWPNVISNNSEAFAIAAEELGRPDLADRFMEAHPTLVGAKPEKRSPKVKGEKVMKSPGKDATAEVRLEFMYKKANDEGAYLDVSNLNANGTGSKIVHRKTAPDATSVKRTAGNEGILISNNYQTYALATQLLGPNFTKYADAFASQHGRGKLERAPAKAKTSPKTKRVTGMIPYQRSASRSPVRKSPSPVRKSPSPSRGRSNSPSMLTRRLSQDRSNSRSRERMLEAQLAEERSVERSLEASLARARSASRSPVRAKTPSPVRSTAARIPIPSRRGLAQAGRTGGTGGQ